MRINPINTMSTMNYARTGRMARKSNLRAENPQANSPQTQPAFKSTEGKLIGGVLGLGLAGLATLATLGAAGPLAAGVLLLSETGGAVVGGAAGHALTGKDEDE